MNYDFTWVQERINHRISWSDDIKNDELGWFCSVGWVDS